MNNISIYILTCNHCDEKYVGFITGHIEEKDIINKHKRMYQSKDCLILNEHIYKYGIENFSIEIINKLNNACVDDIYNRLYNLQSKCETKLNEFLYKPRKIINREKYSENKKNKIYNCSLCDGSFGRKNELKRHMKTKKHTKNIIKRHVYLNNAFDKYVMSDTVNLSDLVLNFI